MRERLEELLDQLRRRFCGHRSLPRYEEFATKTADHSKLYWSAHYVCPDCGEILRVEASWYGSPLDVAASVDEQIRSGGPSERPDDSA